MGVSAPMFEVGNRDALILHYPPPLALVHAVLVLWLVSTANLALALTISRWAPHSRLDRWSRRPAAALLLAVVTLAAVNAAVVRCDRAARPRFLPDAELQWRPVPYADMGDGIRGNALGLRSNDPGPRRPGSRRVLVVGDSATWGASTGNAAGPPIPYPQQMASLARAQGIDLEVVNAAVVGYSSLQGRRMLGALLDAYQPDILLFGYNNDSLPNGGVPDVQRTASSEWVRACQAWLYRLDLYLLLRQHLLRERPGIAAPGPELERVPLPDHLENYRAFIDTARSRGIAPYVLILPSLHGEGFDDADRALARATHTPLIDLHVLMSRAAKSASELLPDGLHPTEEAHGLLARIILDVLIADGAAGVGR